jgi:CzcA family heavy metal efflux pump
VLIFEAGTDMERARQFVQERLVLAHKLPDVAKTPTMLQPLSATSRVMVIGVSSNEISPIELSVLARWKIRPAVMGVPGVANVAMWGQRRRQLQMQMDPERLRAHGVTVDQVVQSAGNALWVSHLTTLKSSYPGTGGWIDTPAQRLGIRHVLPISKPEDLARVAVEGQPLLLGDLGQVVEGYPPLIGDAIVGDYPGLLLVVEKFPGSNTLEVTRRVDTVLNSLRPGLPGVEIDQHVFRPATYLQSAVDNLSTTLLIGALLVALTLALFLFEPRVLLISLMTIPLSLVAAALVLNLRGATLNVMVLAGFAVALGVVVDDAVIYVDRIKRRLRQHLSSGGERSTQAIGRIVLDASTEVRGSMVFATLTLVLAMLPIFVLEGVTGAFFQPLALSYVLALLASTVVALTVTPALSLVFLSRAPLQRRESPLIICLRRGYPAALSAVVRSPRVAFAATGAALLASLAVVPLQPYSPLPSFKERDILVQWHGAAGTSHPEMARLTERARQELATLPGVRNVSAHLGRAVLGDQVVGINSSQLWISLDPRANYETTIGAIQATVAGYPGMSHSVQTYLQERVRQTLAWGSTEPIVVRIYGPDLGVLRTKADEVRQRMGLIPGVTDLRVDVQTEEPRVEVEVDLDKAWRYGLKPGDVRRAAATQVTGLEVGSLFEDQKVFDVVVWSTPQTRHSLTGLRELSIPTQDGNQVRLGDVADVRVKPSATIVRRDANSRRIDVIANVQGRDPAAVAQDVQANLESIRFPLEYHPELLGGFAERRAAQQRTLLAGLVAVFGILLLLQAALDSWRLAALAFLTAPLGLVGGVLVAVIGGGVLSLGAALGLLAVLGISARNAVMQISHYRHLERVEGQPFGVDLVLRGASEQLAPILTTALATGLGLVPLVIFGNGPGQEIVHPLAVVMLGGLVTATLLNLFILPALYLRVALRRAPHGALRP